MMRKLVEKGILRNKFTEYKRYDEELDGWKGNLRNEEG